MVMRAAVGGGLGLFLVLAPAAWGGTLRFVVDDPDGLAARTRVPLMATFLPLERGVPMRLVDKEHNAALVFQQAELPSEPKYPRESSAISSDTLGAPGRSPQVRGCWVMPTGAKGRWVLEPEPAANRSEPKYPRESPTISSDTLPLVQLSVEAAADKSHADILEGGKLVLRYHIANAPLPEGVPARYACGDYIHPLCGPDGEVLTEAHPKDHPHHRGVMWTWPVLKWKGRACNPWVGQGCWTRPEGVLSTAGGPLFAEIRVHQTWKWDDKEPVAREIVTIRAFKQDARCRFVDIELRLTALADDLTISGQPPEGYGGFGLRMARHKNQKMVTYTGTEEEKRGTVTSRQARSWGDYSDTFPGGKDRAGVAIFEGLSNPLYPNAWLKYPGLDFIMPAFPGPRDFALPKGQAIELRHRLWIHPGAGDDKALADQWAAYANPPKVSVAAGE